MSFGRVFRSAANCLLRPLRLELTKYNGGTLAAHTMAGGLARAAQLDFGIRGIVDLGASTGAWSRLALRHFPDARVLAFEPLQERRAALERMKSKDARFDYVAAAAGDHLGTVPFHVADDLDGSGVCSEPASNSRTVEMLTLDATLPRHQLPTPYLLKFDTHGFERPILAGAADVLKSTELIVMEVYNFQLSDSSLRFHAMCEALEEHGFRVFDVVDLMLRKRDRVFWQADFFFARREHPMFEVGSYE